MTGNVIEKVYKNKTELKSQRTFIWSRHSFDKNMIKVAKNLNYELISVGKNQYLSNYLLIGMHNHIDNLFSTYQHKVFLFYINIKGELFFKNEKFLS